MDCTCHLTNCTASTSGSRGSLILSPTSYPGSLCQSGAGEIAGLLALCCLPSQWAAHHSTSLGSATSSPSVPHDLRGVLG